ncbi:MAG: hypothetical protein ACI9E1_000081 [Cryomorphaceae bacterium]|jgi:hypothetical protein
MKPSFYRTLLFATMLGASISHGITIRMGSSANNRFIGSPGATENGSFLYGAYDFSGVGWNTSATAQSVTLISDTHFVAALHNLPGSSVSFRDMTGTVQTYSVSGYTTMSNADYPFLLTSSDLVVGTLTGPVSSEINFYPLLDPSLSPVGQDVLVYGQDGRVGENKISNIVAGGPDGGSTEGILTELVYVKAAGDPNDAYFSDGDSGGPSFIVGNDDELILTGVHWLSGEDADNRYLYDTYTTAYIDQLNAVSGLTVTTSLIPEPSTGMLLGFAILTISLRRRR